MDFASRMSSPVVMAMAVAAALWIAPAMAAELNPSGRQAAGITGARMVSAAPRPHRVWPRYRVASWYTSRLRVAEAVPAAGYWRARPVLLMVGIAY